MMMPYVFYHEIGGIHGIWASWHYSSKSSRQKYTACVPRDPTPSCFCNDVSFWRNIQIFWTKLLHLSVFLVKKYTSLIYVKKSHFVKLIEHFLLWVPQDPFHVGKLRKCFMHMSINDPLCWNSSFYSFYSSSYCATLGSIEIQLNIKWIWNELVKKILPISSPNSRQVFRLKIKLGTIFFTPL